MSRYQNPYYKKKSLTFLYFVLIIVLIGIVYVYDIGGLKTSLNKLILLGNPYPSVSLKDLTQNPSNYVGKNISVSGNMYERGWYSLQDDQGYFVFIDNDCMEQRGYFVQGITTNSPYQYTAKGIFLAPENTQSFNIEGNYRINCSSPLQ